MHAIENIISPCIRAMATAVGTIPNGWSFGPTQIRVRSWNGATHHESTPGAIVTTGDTAKYETHYETERSDYGAHHEDFGAQEMRWMADVCDAMTAAAEAVQVATDSQDFYVSAPIFVVFDGGSEPYFAVSMYNSSRIAGYTIDFEGECPHY